MRAKFSGAISRVRRARGPARVAYHEREPYGDIGEGSATGLGFTCRVGSRERDIERRGCWNEGTCDRVSWKYFSKRSARGRNGVACRIRTGRCAARVVPVSPGPDAPSPLASRAYTPVTGQMFSFSSSNTRIDPVAFPTRSEGGSSPAAPGTEKSVKTPICRAMCAAASVTGDGHFNTAAHAMSPTSALGVAAGIDSVVIRNTKGVTLARARLKCQRWRTCFRELLENQRQTAAHRNGGNSFFLFSFSERAEGVPFEFETTHGQCVIGTAREEDGCDVSRQRTD